MAYMKTIINLYARFRSLKGVSCKSFLPFGHNYILRVIFASMHEPEQHHMADGTFATHQQKGNQQAGD